MFWLLLQGQDWRNGWNVKGEVSAWLPVAEDVSGCKRWGQEEGEATRGEHGACELSFLQDLHHIYIQDLCGSCVSSMFYTLKLQKLYNFEFIIDSLHWRSWSWAVWTLCWQSLVPLSAAEFEELLSLVCKRPLNEIDPRLALFSNMPPAWYSSLLPVLTSRFTSACRFFPSQHQHLHHTVSARSMKHPFWGFGGWCVWCLSAAAFSALPCYSVHLPVSDSFSVTLLLFLLCLLFVLYF